MCLAIVGMAVMPVAVGELGAVALVVTYDSSSRWWWVGVTPLAAGAASVILAPPAGIALWLAGASIA